MTEDLKTLFAADPLRLARHLGLEIGRDGRAWGPFCTPGLDRRGRSPAMSFHSGAIHCFRCGWKGDCFKLVMESCAVDFTKAKEIVAAAYGLAPDSPPELVAKRRKALPTTRKKGKGYATKEELLAALSAVIGPVQGIWKYHNGLFQVRFWNSQDEKKDYRPIHRDKDGVWRAGAGSKPYPLYGLDSLRGKRRVCVTEGELCAQALHELGLAAVTNLSGSGAAEKADWTPLAERDVLIVPDNDRAGLKWQEKVKEITEGLGARVRVREPFGEPGSGYDVADWLSDNNRRPKSWKINRIVR